MGVMPGYRLVQTCASCPTQYDVFLDDGKYAYLRYRHSRLTIELYVDQAQHLAGEPPIMATAQERPDAEFSGSLDHDEVVAILDFWLPTFEQNWDDVREKLGR